jgi:hypothetical protein
VKQSSEAEYTIRLFAARRGLLPVACRWRMRLRRTPAAGMLAALPASLAAGTDVRLVGGSTPNEGRVELREPTGGSPWSTVCDDDWNIPAASVVCRQLGYAGAAKAVLGDEFGGGEGQIAMSNVQCNGWESTLYECLYTKQPNCVHREDAGVVCFGSAHMSPPPPPSPLPPPVPLPPAPPRLPPHPPLAPSPPVTLLMATEAVFDAFPYAAWLLLLCLGATIAATLANACISVEIIVFKDGRRRYRFLNCCWRQAEPSPSESGHSGAADFGQLDAFPPEYQPGGVPRTPPSAATGRMRWMTGWLTGDRDAQEML